MERNKGFIKGVLNNPLQLLDNSHSYIYQLRGKFTFHIQQVTTLPMKEDFVETLCPDTLHFNQFHTTFLTHNFCDNNLFFV